MSTSDRKPIEWPGDPIANWSVDLREAREADDVERVEELIYTPIQPGPSIPSIEGTSFPALNRFDVQAAMKESVARIATFHGFVDPQPLAVERLAIAMSIYMEDLCNHIRINRHFIELETKRCSYLHAAAVTLVRSWRFSLKPPQAGLRGLAEWYDATYRKPALRAETSARAWLEWANASEDARGPFVDPTEAVVDEEMVEEEVKKEEKEERKPIRDDDEGENTEDERDEREEDYAELAADPLYADKPVVKKEQKKAEEVKKEAKTGVDEEMTDLAAAGDGPTQLQEVLQEQNQLLQQNRQLMQEHAQLQQQMYGLWDPTYVTSPTSAGLQYPPPPPWTIPPPLETLDDVSDIEYDDDMEEKKRISRERMRLFCGGPTDVEDGIRSFIGDETRVRGDQLQQQLQQLRQHCREDVRPLQPRQRQHHSLVALYSMKLDEIERERNALQWQQGPPTHQQRQRLAALQEMEDVLMAASDPSVLNAIDAGQAPPTTPQMTELLDLLLQPASWRPQAQLRQPKQVPCGGNIVLEDYYDADVDEEEEVEDGEVSSMEVEVEDDDRILDEAFGDFDYNDGPDSERYYQ